MLQAARVAPKALRDAADLVRDFYLAQLNDDGGFKNRDGSSDLYYTVFGLEGLMALRADVPAARVRTFLDSFGEGAGLDFIHAACLARCRANLGISDPDFSPRLIENIERHRTPDGGYHQSPAQKSGTVYAAFLALGAYQDMNRPMPDAERLIPFLDSMKTSDGAFANDRGMPIGSTPATAAAITILRLINQPLPQSSGEWLLARAHPKGGFLAMPRAPIPDLLSTAVALHALAGMEIDFAPFKESCLDFVDTLWTNLGGFHGNWTDETLDAEYTYYGLLALGHLTI